MNTYPFGHPARMGRRVWARAIDMVLSIVLSFALQAGALASMLNGSSGLFVVVMVLFGGYTVFGLWTVFGRAALPGQWLLGLHHVDVATGRRAGGKTFLKYLVQACTFGFALLITPTTIQAPNRSWFDRLAGVTLVDSRSIDPVVAPPVSVAPPPTGWHVDESHLTQLGQSAPQEQGVVGGMIQSVPFEGARPAAPASAPRVVERSVPVVVEAPYAAARPQIGATAKVPVATLDTGEALPVIGTTILGRAPRPSASLGEAALFAVSDQSISANHLALGVGATGPWVMDLKSTNGATVEQDGAPALRLEPLVRVPLSPGAVVKFGQRSFVVSAR